jgi:hypothetical protein
MKRQGFMKRKSRKRLRTLYTHPPFFSALEQRRTEADRKKLSSRSNKADLSEGIVYSTILLPNKASKKIVKVKFSF